MTKTSFNRKKTIRQAVSNHRTFNLKYFNIFLVTVLAGLGVFYLVLINDLTVQGFALQHLNNQANNLATINMNDQEAINMAQSSENLNSRIANLGLVAVNDVQYLSVPEPIVARR